MHCFSNEKELLLEINHIGQGSGGFKFFVVTMVNSVVLHIYDVVVYEHCDKNTACVFIIQK